MIVHLLVLNYNGRDLLAECLPSVVEAARCSRHDCRPAVIDNASTDGSVDWLAAHHPQVEVIRCPNRGLCSYNEVVASLSGRVAVLLNNDIKLHPRCIDRLVAPLEEPSPCFLSAPLCWRFDGRTYEGFRTAIDWRWGLVQATALFSGYESGIRQPGPTASAGAVMAVDAARFCELGGFDPLYLPGRLEDLDLAYRAYQAGYHAEYVPGAVAYHRGMATFSAEFGPSGCDALALRNTLLFQWKNLRRPSHVARQLFGLGARLAADVLRAPWTPGERRFATVRALCGALRRVGQLWNPAFRSRGDRRRERAFFAQFHPAEMVRRAGSLAIPVSQQPLRSPEEIGRPEACSTVSTSC